MRHGYGRQRGQLEQVHYHRVLEELGLSPREFVEFCVLCGCDFTGKLRRIGPVRALKIIKTHGSIGTFL